MKNTLALPARARPAAVLPCLVLALLLSSCDIVENPATSTTSGNQGTTVTGATWSTYGGAVRFYSNSTDDCGYSFYNVTDTSSAPSTITGTVMRASGYYLYGNGFVWGYKDVDNYYAVLIDTEGNYTVLKDVAGTETSVKTWTYTSTLHVGMSVPNTISVTYSSGGYYSVAFNGTVCCTFYRDSSLLSSGRCGFLANVGSSSLESFPGTPVDVRFTMTSPGIEP